MLIVKQFVFNPFEESTYVAADEKTGDAIVIDPGMFRDTDQQLFDNFVSEQKIKITQIVNTHMHVDHCFGANWVKSKYGVKLAANKGDAEYGRSAEIQARRFGMHRDMAPVEIDVELEDGDIIEVGESRLKVLHVPGHSQGGIALYSKEDGLLFSGDSLFQGSIGRTDFEGGNHEQLIESIRKKLLTLPQDTIVLPGHGPFTTIGDEIKYNPYLKD